LSADHTLGWEHLNATALIYASQRNFMGDSVPMRDLIEAVLDLPDR
jgi:hypothetical protein